MADAKAKAKAAVHTLPTFWDRCAKRAARFGPLLYVVLYAGGVGAFFAGGAWNELADRKRLAVFGSNTLFLWNYLRAAVTAVILNAAVSFYYACKTSPGEVPKNCARSAALLARVYPYDHLLYFPDSICRTCHVAKPARSKHCRMCDVCVMRMDHHCLWINNCVGHANHHVFVYFLFSTLVLVATVGLCAHRLLLADFIQGGLLRAARASAQVSAHPLLNRPYQLLRRLIFLEYEFEAVWLMAGGEAHMPTRSLASAAIIATLRRPGYAAALMLCVIAAPFILAFTFFHLWPLVTRGETTNEAYKRSYLTGNAPHIYNKGVFSNILEILWPVPLPLLHADSKISLAPNTKHTAKNKKQSKNS